MSNALNFDPTVNPYENGSFGISETITQEIINPLAQIDNTYNQNKVDKIQGKIELQHELMENLNITSRFGYTYVDIYGKSISFLFNFMDLDIIKQMLIQIFPQ